MKLVTGETMCDVDGCSSIEEDMKTYEDGVQLCQYHTYLRDDLTHEFRCRFCDRVRSSRGTLFTQQSLSHHIRERHAPAPIKKEMK